jgi:hypothetical protein
MAPFTDRNSGHFGFLSSTRLSLYLLLNRQSLERAPGLIGAPMGRGDSAAQVRFDKAPPHFQ